MLGTLLLEYVWKWQAPNANQDIALFIMAFRSSLVLVLYAIHAGAANTILSTELTNLLPVCAHACFSSFLDLNFASSKCGINPTLDCLCTTKSTSEYTVGEGAVQCVLSTAACTQGGAPGRFVSECEVSELMDFRFCCFQGVHYV